MPFPGQLETQDHQVQSDPQDEVDVPVQREYVELREMNAVPAQLDQREALEILEKTESPVFPEIWESMEKREKRDKKVSTDSKVSKDLLAYQDLKDLKEDLDQRETKENTALSKSREIKDCQDLKDSLVRLEDLEHPEEMDLMAKKVYPAAQEMLDSPDHQEKTVPLVPQDDPESLVLMVRTCEELLVREVEMVMMVRRELLDYQDCQDKRETQLKLTALSDQRETKEWLVSMVTQDLLEKTELQVQRENLVLTVFPEPRDPVEHLVVQDVD